MEDFLRSFSMVLFTGTLLGLSQAYLSTEHFVFWSISKNEGYELHSDSEKGCWAAPQSSPWMGVWGRGEQQQLKNILSHF